jgi:hypothetical protein
MHHDHIKLILDLDQNPDGRLTGSVVLPGDLRFGPSGGDGTGGARRGTAHWQGLAARVEAIASDAHARGHKVSARNAYLRAAAYYAAALTAIDGAEGGADLLGPVFTAHRRCFDAHARLLEPSAEAVAIPYEGGTLSGYLFLPAADGQARPTLILNNGSDGPMTGYGPDSGHFVALQFVIGGRLQPHIGHIMAAGAQFLLAAAF